MAIPSNAGIMRHHIQMYLHAQLLTSLRNSWNKPQCPPCVCRRLIHFLTLGCIKCCIPTYPRAPRRATLLLLAASTNRLMASAWGLLLARVHVMLSLNNSLGGRDLAPPERKCKSKRKCKCQFLDGALPVYVQYIPSPLE
jgi:hypothetical protein